MTNDTPATGPAAVTQADQALRDEIIALEWPGNHAAYEAELDAIIARHRIASLSEPSPQPVAGGSVREAAQRLRCGMDSLSTKRGVKFSAQDWADIETLVAAMLASAPQPASGGVRGDTSTAIAGAEGRTVEGVMAEMRAVAVASIEAEDGDPILEDWPLDCRADVDRWQSVISRALAKGSAMLGCAMNNTSGVEGQCKRAACNYPYCEPSAAAPKPPSEDTPTHAPGSGEVERACERAWDATHTTLWRHVSAEKRAEWEIGISAALSTTPPQTSSDGAEG